MERSATYLRFGVLSSVQTLMVALCFVLGSATSADAGVDADEIVFTPVADTHVSAAAPSTSYASALGMWIDAKPVKQAFMRFDVQALAGRTIQRVVLRMQSTDASPSGGAVHVVPSSQWPETITFNTRPALGAQVGAFGAVANGSYYEAVLNLDVSSGGPISLAVTSPSNDAARWASREQLQVPELIVEVAPQPGLTVDGLSVVAGGYQGSSDATYYSTNPHLATTAAGRQLAVHGLHKQGVQLAWRDSAGSWRRRSTGGVPDGVLLSGAGTGDRPAGISVFRDDSSGAESAWAFWSGPTPRSSVVLGVPVQMRQISSLDAQAGPTVGPTITVAPPSMGNFRADMAFERTATGEPRAVITWVRRTGSNSYELVVSGFDPRDPSPALTTPHVLATYTAPTFSSTIVATSAGTQLIARLANGRPTVFSHTADAPLSSWSQGAPGAFVDTKAVVAATGIANGDLVSVVETNSSSHVVSVQRYRSGQPQPVEATFTGYTQPAIASDGSSIWVVMVRLRDGFVVSRTFRPTTGWSSEDRVEVGAEGGGGYRWPSVQPDAADGRLRILVRATGSPSSTSRVLAFQRVV